MNYCHQGVHRLFARAEGQSPNRLYSVKQWWPVSNRHLWIMQIVVASEGEWGAGESLAYILGEHQPGNVVGGFIGIPSILRINCLAPYLQPYGCRQQPYA